MARFNLSNVSDCEETLSIQVDRADGGDIHNYWVVDYNRSLAFDNALEVLQYAICEGDYKVGDTLAFSNVDGDFWWTDDAPSDFDVRIDYVYQVTSIN